MLNPQLCTCTGVCRGPEGLGEGWICALQTNRPEPRAERHREPRIAETLNPNGTRIQVMQWLEGGTYRYIIHRHDKTFRALDDSERKYLNADTIPLLADALMNWPANAKSTT